MHFAILHIPHSSVGIPPRIRDSFAISEDALDSELRRITDLFTDDLFDFRDPLVVRLVYPVSRLVVDPERFLDGGKHEALSGTGRGGGPGAHQESWRRRDSTEGAGCGANCSSGHEPHRGRACQNQARRIGRAVVTVPMITPENG